jgi:hypothetical protein
MIGRKDMKKETMAKRARKKAMDAQMGKKMVSPRKRMDMGMSPGPDMGPSSAPTRRAPAMAAPPMMPPMGMKKGGAVDKKKAMAMKDGGMAMKKNMKGKEGMMLIIGLGKKGK